MTQLEILVLTPTITATSSVDGICITGVTENSKSSEWVGMSPDSRAFLTRIPSLLSTGIFEYAEGGIKASLEKAAQLEQLEDDPFAPFFSWSPFSLEIQGKGTLGFGNFSFVPRFYQGKKLIPFTAHGLFGQRAKLLYRLPGNQALALAECARFNALPSQEKTKAEALKALFTLQGLVSRAAQVSLDSYLQSEIVIKPSKVRITADDNGTFATAYPVFEGVSEEECKRQFLNMTEVQDVYDLPTANGRKRVVVDPEVKKVLKKIKTNGIALSNKKREDFYRNPASLFPEDDSIDLDVLDLTKFGPRVEGIGYPNFVRPIASHKRENWFDRSEDEAESLNGSDIAESLALEIGFIDGGNARVEFQDVQEANDFVEEMQAAIAAGESSMTWNGMSLPVNQRLLANCHATFGPKPRQSEDEEKPPTSGPVILIKDEFEETTSAPRPADFALVKPVSLKRTTLLKTHQDQGIQWLQNLIHNDHAKGGLLADEMGLGKTLQILSFAAWCIEAELKATLAGAHPYEPVLIVAPLILLQNWADEMGKYFDSQIFQPVEILHGDRLKKYKLITGARDIDVTKATLDLDKIRLNRVIITNYDTVKNYQFSLGQIPWSLIILDEAQEIKDHQTMTTQAIKAFMARFRIASTGTPVETSLTNLWSIVDFLQPGSVVGSQKEFNKRFVGKDVNDKSIGDDLRKMLRYNKTNGFVLRRTKKDVLKDLPKKHFVTKTCDLDDHFRAIYLGILNSVKASSDQRAAALRGIQQLSIIAQHPFLIEDNPFRADHQDYVRASSKLSAMMDILRDINSKREKVLIFTRSLRMQEILKVVIDREFNLDLKIINGSTKSVHKYVENTRASMIEKFSESPGFNALILSPEVAGVGLTIVAANHVIHYGRWWNPAKEAQATDRAYRIGQTKPVYVYNLILKDPKGEFETFDEKLDRLLSAREDLADNFLEPSDADRSIEDGLVADIFSQSNAAPSQLKPGRPIDMDRLSGLSPYEFEALCGVLLKARCSRVILTPKAGDRGVDVIGISDKEIILVQSKHQAAGQKTSAESAVNELVDGLDYYREVVIPKELKSLPIYLRVMMSGVADTDSKSLAKRKSIELIDRAVIEKMLKNNPVSFSDLLEIEGRRARDIESLFDVL